MESLIEKSLICLINPYHATGLFLYSLKASENQRYRKRPLHEMG